jgi:5-methylcytosine-specific restriction protein A
MPRAPRACAAPGCGNERGQCPKHRPVPWAEKGNPRSETGDKAYRRRNQQILTRDHRRCHKCGGHATEVDHVIPLCFDGADHPHNLAAICTPCHKIKTAAEAAEMRRRHRDNRARQRR